MSKKIGVLVSRGYGVGWSTWGKPEMALDKEIVNALESGLSSEEMREIAKENWPNECLGGLSGLFVVWVDEGTLFKITEYDGAESLEIKKNTDWLIAQ